MKIAIYPGSFDPVTNGHIDIIERASKTWDQLIVAVLKNNSKTPMFSLEERVKLIKEAILPYPNVSVDCFSGLLVDYAEQKKANVIVKGLRAVSDFEYEFQMALMNRNLCPKIETVFLMTSSKYSYLSSSLVKEVARFGGTITELVPKHVEEIVISRLKEVQ